MSKPVEFSQYTRKRRTIRGEIGETVAGVQLNNNTESTKPERNEQGRKKYEDRLEMSVHNGHVRVVTGAWLRDFSTSGLPVVGG
jgi:hypothetical protein